MTLHKIPDEYCPARHVIRLEGDDGGKGKQHKNARSEKPQKMDNLTLIRVAEDRPQRNAVQMCRFPSHPIIFRDRMAGWMKWTTCRKPNSRLKHNTGIELFKLSGLRRVGGGDVFVVWLIVGSCVVFRSQSSTSHGECVQQIIIIIGQI